MPGPGHYEVKPFTESRNLQSVMFKSNTDRDILKLMSPQKRGIPGPAFYFKKKPNYELRVTVVSNH